MRISPRRLTTQDMCQRVRAAITEVFSAKAKSLARGNHLFKIAVRRSYEAKINFLRIRASQSFEFLLLQCPQQLRLDFNRNVADFVKKQRALVGQFESADFLGDGARKSALLVAKQFALQQAGGNGRTIYLHQRTILPPTAIMNGAGNQFLTRSSFSKQQNG